MIKFTLLIDNDKMIDVYRIIDKFICFVDVKLSMFRGIKEVTFECRKEDAVSLERELGKLV